MRAGPAIRVEEAKWKHFLWCPIFTKACRSLEAEIKLIIMLYVYDRMETNLTLTFELIDEMVCTHFNNEMAYM